MNNIWTKIVEEVPLGLLSVNLIDGLSLKVGYIFDKSLPPMVLDIAPYLVGQDYNVLTDDAADGETLVYLTELGCIRPDDKVHLVRVTHVVIDDKIVPIGRFEQSLVDVVLDVSSGKLFSSTVNPNIVGFFIEGTRTNLVLYTK